MLPEQCNQEMNMQVLHSRWTNLVENLSALMISLPLVFCAYRQENWPLCRSALLPFPYPYPRAPFSAYHHWPPQVIPKHTAWGKYRVTTTRFECPHRWGNVLSENGNACSIFAFASSCWTGLRLCFTECKQLANVLQITHTEKSKAAIALNGEIIPNGGHMKHEGKHCRIFLRWKIIWSS